MSDDLEVLTNHIMGWLHFDIIIKYIIKHWDVYHKKMLLEKLMESMLKK